MKWDQVRQVEHGGLAPGLFYFFAFICRKIWHSVIFSKMYKKFLKGYDTGKESPSENNNSEDEEKSARQVQSVTEALISRGLTNLSVVSEAKFLPIPSYSTPYQKINCTVKPV